MAFLYSTLYHFLFINDLFFSQQVFHYIIVGFIEYMVQARIHLKVKEGGADNIPIRSPRDNRTDRHKQEHPRQNVTNGHPYLLLIFISSVRKAKRF